MVINMNSKFRYCSRNIQEKRRDTGNCIDNRYTLRHKFIAFTLKMQLFKVMVQIKFVGVHRENFDHVNPTGITGSHFNPYCLSELYLHQMFYCITSSSLADPN